MHEAAAPLDQEPAPHVLHALEPLTLAYWPATQMSHASAPAELLKVPVGLRAGTARREGEGKTESG